MTKKPYNVFELSIDTGLDAVACGTAGGYISLLEAPTNANVQIHLNDRAADPIPLKAYHAVEATEIERIFVSADAVANAKIKLVQAKRSQDFKMITPASDVNVDSINKILDRFRPDGTAIQQTIIAGSSYTFTKSNETMIRFHASDELGVELDNTAIKYPMFEEELYIDNINTLKFHNDTASSVVLTVWSM